MKLPSKCANLVCCIVLRSMLDFGRVMFRLVCALPSLALVIALGFIPAYAQVLVTSNVSPSVPPNPISIVDSNPASPTFNTVTSTVDNNELHSTSTMAFSPDGAYAYLTGDVPGVEAVNLLFNSVDGFIDAGFGPPEATFMDVGPDGTGYVAGYGAGNPRVVVINTLDRSIVATIPLDGSPAPVPASVAVRPDGGVVYVLVDWLSSVARILVISADTREVVAVIPVPRVSTGVSFTPDGAYAYVKTKSNDCGSSAPNVQIIDTLTNQIVAEVPGTRCANDIAFRPDGAAAYITYYNFGGFFGVVRVVDTGTRTVVDTISLPGNPINTYGITVSSQGYAYVEATNQDGTPTVFVIYTLTDNVVGTVSGLPSGFPAIMKAM